MDKKAYVRFLETNCPEAYKQYNKGKKVIISGWCLFGAGLACAGGGVLHQYLADINWKNHVSGMYYNYSQEQKDKVNAQEEKYEILSYAMIGFGGLMTVTSIPVLSVGYAKQKKALRIYNKQCSSPSIPPLTFNLTAGPNGLGVAMNF